MTGAVVLTLVGCSDGGDEGLFDDSLNSPPPVCAVDASNSYDSPWDATVATAVQDTFCPRTDEDFWRLNLSTGNKLVEAVVTYDKLANVRLALDAQAPQGRCVRTGASCTDASGCNMGEICDTARGFCRTGATLCTTHQGCAAGETCIVSAETLGCVLEQNGGNSVLHRLQTTFPATEPGDYIVKVFDHNEEISDDQTSYSLTLNVLNEPDTHEPNDTEALATALTSGQTVTGYLSHPRDVDQFTIVPSFATPAIATIDLQWADGAKVSPSWTLTQGSLSIPSVVFKEVGALNQRTETLALSASTPITVRVAHTGVLGSNCGALGEATQSGFDTATPYTLTVTVFEDTNEGATRNDTPDTPRTYAAGAPGSGSYTNTGTLVANNDRDWYRIDRDPGVTDNSLLRIQLDSTSNNFLSQFTVYRVCDPAISGDCPPGGPCLSDNTCLTVALQRPGPDGPGDPQLGGLSPNALQAQIPLTSNDPTFVVINHIASTPADLPGFSATDTYQLQLQHLVEPDVTERTNPDNCFVSRPLGPGVNRDTFCPSPRAVPAGQWNLSGPGGGTPFADLDTATQVPAGVCTPLTFRVYDATGTPNATSVSFSVTAAAGSFVDDCTAQGALGTVTVSTASITVGYNAPAGVQDVSVTTNVNGSSATLTLPVFTPSLRPSIAIASVGGNAARRGFVTTYRSQALRLTFNPPSTEATTLRLTTSRAQVGVQCSSDATACPNAASVTGGTPCAPDTALADCRIALAPNQTSYDLQMIASTPGLVVLTVADATPTPVFAPATLARSAYNGTTFSFNTPLSGYISYDGDQDFFSVPFDTIPVPRGLMLTVNLTYPASSVDIRASAQRGSAGASIGRLELVSPGDDCNQSGCTCDSYDQCQWNTAFSESRGVDATSPECVYMTEPGELLVWINDIDANDADINNAYSFNVTIREGCAPTPTCDALACAQ